jgi:hypothetical protein
MPHRRRRRESAGKAGHVVADRIPEAELWREVGIVWREAPGGLVPYVVGDRRPWGFLPGNPEPEEEPPEWERPGLRPRPVIVVPPPTLLGREQVVEMAQRLRLEGKEWASARDFQRASSSGGEDPVNGRRLGMVMADLLVPSRRVWVDGGQVRVYYLPAIPESMRSARTSTSGLS